MSYSLAIDSKLVLDIKQLFKGIVSSLGVKERRILQSNHLSALDNGNSTGISCELGLECLSRPLVPSGSKNVEKRSDCPKSRSFFRFATAETRPESDKNGELGRNKKKTYSRIVSNKLTTVKENLYSHS